MNNFSRRRAAKPNIGPEVSNLIYKIFEHSTLSTILKIMARNDGRNIINRIYTERLLHPNIINRIFILKDCFTRPLDR